MSPITPEGEKSRSWTEFWGEGGAEGSDGDHPDDASRWAMWCLQTHEH